MEVLASIILRLLFRVRIPIKSNTSETVITPPTTAPAIAPFPGPGWVVGIVVAAAEWVGALLEVDSGAELLTLKQET